MKISMSLLKKYLSPYYSMQGTILEDRMEIRGVRFISDQRFPLSPEYVYLGQAENYFSDPKYNNSCILVSGKSRILCKNCDYEELLNDILGAFDYFADFEERLRKAASSSASVQQMVDLASTVIRSPVAVLDIEGNLLGLAGESIPGADPYWDDMVKNRKLADQTLTQRYLDSSGQLSRDLSDHPQLLHMENTSVSAVCMYLYADREPVGFVLIEQTDDLETEMDLQLCSLLSVFFCAPRNSPEKPP
ncbi:MAG: hypothetical protein LUF78_08635 [Clostridiales bacterium]|nr:hypothetical protein [Clostridiales bacterium]